MSPVTAPQPPDLPDVVKVAEELAQGRRQDLDVCLQVILAGLRQRLGFDVTFVGELVGDERVLRAVDADQDHGAVLTVGAAEPIDVTYCGRVVDGRLPEYVRDARAQPAVQGLPVTRSIPIGTHLSVPIRFTDGTVFGTLCGFTCVPDTAIQARDLGVMRLLARLLSRHLEAGRLPPDVQEKTHAEVLAVIRGGGPHMVFQPVRDLTTMAVVGYEALSRFGDDLLPDAWFARAAVVGLGVELEVAAVARALHLAQSRSDGVYLAVNASAAALCSASLAQAMTGVDLSHVVVELTEQTGVSDYALLRARVDDLRGRGGRIAIDDTGSGHAGLQRILEIAPDMIKLDRGLVHDVVDDQARQALVSALTWFSQRTGATLVAEGIESVDEAIVLRDLGVPFGQGYHLGEPAALPSR